MEIINLHKDFKIYNPTVVTIGSFDGVHLGHQEILKSIVHKAQTEQKKSVVVTFFPHPRLVLEKNPDLKLINSIKEKSFLLEVIGIDYLIVIPFNVEFANSPAIDFISNILVNQLNTSDLFIGYDHQFGRNREGNFELLQQQGEIYNFKVHEIDAVSLKEITISSTKIRNSLEKGDIINANTYLGYPFFITGKVVTGQNLGSTIGFPTANIAIEDPHKLIPKVGVYVVKSTLNNQTVFGMMNIGNRPTVNGKNQTIEVHFFNFNQYIYGDLLKIEFLTRLRDEQKFESIEALQHQLKIDQRIAEEFIKINNIR